MKDKMVLKVIDKLYFNERSKKQINDLNQFTMNLKTYEIQKTKTLQEFKNLRKWSMLEIAKSVDLVIYTLGAKN